MNRESAAVPYGGAERAARRSTTARFAIEGVAGPAPLPPVTATLPLAEMLRRALLTRCQQLVRRRAPHLVGADLWSLSPAFWGKDAQGRPRTGHEHAFFLPADEDGDGRLDHVTIRAAMGLNALECEAIELLAQVPLGAAGCLHLRRIGLGSDADFRAPLLDEATVWQSATPFLVTRYPKRRGRKRDRPADYASPQVFARHVFRQELQRRPDLPTVAALQDEETLGPLGLRPGQFQRARRKAGDDGARRPAGAFTVTFAAPLRGPLCLGHACHFGLGLFVPSSSPAGSRANER